MLIPRIGQRVLEREADLLRFGVELHDLDVDDVADLHDLGRMLDPRVRELAVVNQTVDAAEIDERAELGETNDDAFANLPDFERIRAALASWR